MNKKSGFTLIELLVVIAVGQEHYAHGYVLLYGGLDDSVRHAKAGDY